MKAVIYLADLYAENAHLMPWRVPLEIATHWPGDNDSIAVWSGTDDVWKQSKGELLISWILVRYIPRVKHDIADLQKRIQSEHVDVLFFPISFTHFYDWAESFEVLTGCKVVWYLPGGFFSVRQCISSLKYLPWKRALPYFVQALFPKQAFINRLMWGRERNIICFSDASAEKLRGFCSEKSVFSAVPGSDPEEVFEEAEKNTDKYFLFLGPPDSIRGIDVLLKAFEMVCQNHPACRVHFCLRPDKNLDTSPFLAKVKASLFSSNIDIRMTSLDKDEMKHEVRNCLAVVMPFLIVPSEIPLAVLEAARMGKIVLTSGPDGTGALISQFGLVSKHGSVTELARNMNLLLEDSVLYRNLSDAAKEISKNLPTWDDAAKNWYDATVHSCYTKTERDEEESQVDFEVDCIERN